MLKEGAAEAGKTAGNGGRGGRRSPGKGHLRLVHSSDWSVDPHKPASPQIAPSSDRRKGVQGRIAAKTPDMTMVLVILAAIVGLVLPAVLGSWFNG